MRGTNVVSSQHRPSDSKPERGQVTNDAPEVGTSIPGKQPWNVLSEHESGSNSAHNLAEGGPHVPLVFGASTFSGDTEGLTWKASRNHIRNASVLGGPTS
jgi:hypothetical protein